MNELRLVVLDGPDTGKSFELSGAVVVGRDDTAGIVLGDPEVSRRHASLALGDGGVEVEDLESMNGTWVAGHRIQERCSVAPGDKIRVGRTLMQLVVPTAETHQADQPSTGSAQETHIAGAAAGDDPEASTQR